MWIRTLCQRLIATPCSGRDLSGKASSGDSGTPSQLSQASFDTRSSSCRNHSSKVSTTVLSCTCPEAFSTYDPQQNRMVSQQKRPSELKHADGREEEPEAVTQHEHSHQDVASRRGAMSCRRRGRVLRVVGHLVSCSFSAMSASPLEHRVLRTLATRKLCLLTLEHFLYFLLQSANCFFNDTEMFTAPTFDSTVHYAFMSHTAAGTTDLSGDSFMVPPHCASR